MERIILLHVKLNVSNSVVLPSASVMIEVTKTIGHLLVMCAARINGTNAMTSV